MQTKTALEHVNLDFLSTKMFLFINVMSTYTSWNAAFFWFLPITKGIFRRDMNDVVLWAPFHLRCYNSFKLQLWPGSHASWAFSFSIAPMSCLATTVFFSGDNVLPWNTSLHHIQILICHVLHPLAFSRPVRSLAANKALHRRSSRVWCWYGT